jgi:hypothetical protein
MATDHLFKLVKALSKNEKVYIKRSAALHTIGERNKYLKLFDLLCTMKEYDERLLRKRFGDDPFLRHLSAAKNYLLNTILHILESYHQTGYSEIRSCLHQVEILEDKGLIELCRKKIARAEFLAKKYQLVEQLFSIYSWKYHLHPTGMKKEEYLKYMDLLHKNIKEVINQIGEYADIKNEFYQVLGKVQYLDSKPKEERVRLLTEEAKRIGIHKESDFHSFYAQFNFVTIMRTLAAHTGNITQGLQYVELTDQLFTSHPHMIEVELYNYLFNLREKINYELELDKYGSAVQSYRVLDRLFDDYGSSKKIIGLLLNNMKLSHCIRFGEFEPAKIYSVRLFQIFRQIDTAERYVEERKLLLIRTAILRMGLRDFKECFRCLNELLDTSAKEMAGELHYFAQLFQLIAYYEKGESELVEYKARAVYRKLLRKKGRWNAEKLLVDFFKHHVFFEDSKEKAEAFTLLKKDIVAVFESNPEERHAFRYFNVLDWISSKIENCSFTEILRSKYSKLYESEEGKDLIEYLKEEKRN